MSPFVNHSFRIEAVERNFFAKYNDKTVKTFTESKDRVYLKRKQEMLKLASES